MPISRPRNRWQIGSVGGRWDRRGRRDIGRGGRD